MKDVRISTHTARTQSHDFVIIRFYEGLENLIGANYVLLIVEGERLYFKPSEVKVKGSLKLNYMVNVWKQVAEIRPFVGEYSIEFDRSRDLYYVDINNRSDITRDYGNKNVPHPNYKSHVNEPYVSEEIIPILPKMRKYSMTVYDGLLELLRVQISDLNKSAIHTTLNTIKLLIEDE